MKKLLLFSLFLMGSIIMLVPFVNTNLFLDAMAQEYDNYNNYNDDMYSKYPTNINKYECQKGPFEGFFVSSVEFCKRAPIVDGSGGNNGTTGPQGPAGANSTIPGPPGPRGFNGTNGINGTEGPAGPNQIPPTKIYVNSGPFAITTPVNSSLGFASTNATCNSGDTAISGQHIIQPLVRIIPGSSPGDESFAGSYISGFESFSNPPTNNAWTFNLYGNNLRITPFVTCFDN